MEHGNWFSLSIVVILSGMILWKIRSARGGRQLFIRKIPGVDAIDEAVGRATEMGRPILFSTGLGDLNIVTLQALSIVGRVARLAAQYRTRLIVPMVDTVVLPVAEEICREAYNEAGQAEAFNPDDIRFLSGSQFAYASGVVGIMNRERVSANFMFGSFFAEALILAETGQSVGAVQVAGTPSTLQIPFFIVSCDYTIIGEEYYATSAYLTRQPTLLGSLVGQDYGKIFLGVAIVLGLLAAVLLGKVCHQPKTARQVTLSAATAPAVRAPVEARGILSVPRPSGSEELEVRLPLDPNVQGTLVEKFLISPEAGPTVKFAARLLRDGDYVLWARIGVQGAQEDTFDVQVDGEKATTIGGGTVAVGAGPRASPEERSWVRIGAYPLKRGKHRVAVTWRTAQGRLDKLVFCRAKAWYQAHPDALAFHAASAPDVKAPVQATTERLVSTAGGSVRFPFKMHQKGAYTLWLRLGPTGVQEPLQQPTMRVRVDNEPAVEVGGEDTEKGRKGERETQERGNAEGKESDEEKPPQEKPSSLWAKASAGDLTAGAHTLTVEWLEEAALYEIVLSRPEEFDPATAKLSSYYADYVPDDLSANDFLVEPIDRYLRLWKGE
jgi:hypothetical protein